MNKDHANIYWKRNKHYIGVIEEIGMFPHLPKVKKFMKSFKEEDWIIQKICYGIYL